MSKLYDAMKRAGRDESGIRPQLVPFVEPTTALEPRGEVQLETMAMSRGSGANQIARNILAIKADERPRVFVITAAMSGDGTSYVAARVADALSARRTRRVLLVDANLHEPSQHVSVGLNRSHGLSEVLVNGQNYEAAVQGTSTYSLLVAGRPAEDPCSLFESAEARTFFSRLRKDYDFVVIDTPSICDYPDAAVLAGLADASILVLQAERTRFEDAEEARDLLLQTGTPILGGVLNRQREYIPKWLRRFL
jgi:capsular exopolysaccharide synthesis family protein